jgi:hypothetical protein
VVRHLSEGKQGQAGRTFRRIENTVFCNLNLQIRMGSMNIKPAIIIVALGVSVLPAKAETAREMQLRCTGVAKAVKGSDRSIEFLASPDSYRCWGAFTAVQELVTIADPTDGPILEVCVPSDSTRLQMIKIFQKYAGDHPEDGHLPFGYVVLKALWKAFPCKDK